MEPYLNLVLAIKGVYRVVFVLCCMLAITSCE